jgi:hypothetical protein
MGNKGAWRTSFSSATACASLLLTLPPLATLFLRYEGPMRHA